MLGNSLPHLHTHVVPRYLDDGSPGKPARYMRDATGWDRKISEDVIVRDAAALRKLLEP